MPYLKFDSFPASTQGRTLTDGITDPDTGEYLAATSDELLDTDTAVSDADYAEALVRATAAYEATLE